MELSKNTGKEFYIDDVGIHRNKDDSPMHWVKNSKLTVATSQKEADRLISLGYRIVIP